VDPVLRSSMSGTHDRRVSGASPQARTFTSPSNPPKCSDRPDARSSAIGGMVDVAGHDAPGSPADCPVPARDYQPACHNGAWIERCLTGIQHGGGSASVRGKGSTDRPGTRGSSHMAWASAHSCMREFGISIFMTAGPILRLC
jgi:hypothetical protein